MAVTITNVKKHRESTSYKSSFDVTGPASYTTGGETLTAAQQAQIMPEAGAPAAADFSKVQFFESERDASGRQYVLDKANNKLLAFAAGAEVGSGVNLSAVTIKCQARYGNVLG